MGTTSQAGVGAIASALFGKTRRSLLALFFGHPDEPFYLRQVARIAGSGVGTVQRELKTLTDAGLLKRTIVGRQVFYAADHACPVFEEMKSLVLKTSGLVDVLQAALAPVSEHVQIAFLYGSMARAGQQRGSDVDLMVIGNIRLRQLVPALRQAESVLRREVNQTVYSLLEFREKLSSGNEFLQTVIAGPRLFLIGDDHEIAAMVRKRVSGSAQDRPRRNR
jgi:predicted nucleotidyltransferase